jgi:hypothetical protein
MRRAKLARLRPPILEMLERRRLLAKIIVTGTGDDISPVDALEY